MARSKDTRLDDVLHEVRRVADTQVEMLKVQARQHVTLEEHMRRTEVAEEAIASLRDEMTPLKTHAAVWGALAKILTAVGTLVAIGMGVLKLLGG